MFSRIKKVRNQICDYVAKRKVLISNPKQREIQTHLTWQEKLLLLKLTKSIQKEYPDALCVEIGSYIGASAELIASQLKDGKLPNLFWGQVK
jgi:predicted O-methyltransferase YrrM